MRRKERIELTDSPLSAMVKLAEGNPGAATALAECCAKGAEIDPDSAWGAVGALLALDSHGIYGSKIWMLYKDCCGSNVTRLLAALRAVQLGLMREGDLLDAIDSGRALDCVSMVQERLPAFAPVAEIGAS